MHMKAVFTPYIIASMVAPSSSNARMVNTPISSTTTVDMSTSSLMDTTTSSVMTSLVSPTPVVTISVVPSPTPLTTGEQDYCYYVY